MVGPVKEPQYYRSAVKTFQRLDRKDGKQDGAISLKEGKSSKPLLGYDLNHDKCLTLGEFLLYQLPRTAPKEIRDKINNFGKVVGSKEVDGGAGWTGSEISMFLQIVFAGGGAEISDILTEINYFGTAEVLREFKTLKWINWDGSEQFLLEKINSVNEPSPTKLNRLLNAIVALWGCFKYFQKHVDVIKSFSDVSKPILSTLIRNPINNPGGRMLFANLCMYIGEELSSGSPKEVVEIIAAWSRAFNSPSLPDDDEKIDFLATAIAYGKIKTVEDLNSWIKILSAGKQDLAPLWDLLPILQLKEAKELVSWYQNLPGWQQNALRSLIKKGAITSSQELKEILPLLVKPDTVVYHLDYPSLSLKERVPYIINCTTYNTIRELSQRGDAVASIIDYIASLNESDVSREEGYAGDETTMLNTLNWDWIFYFVTKDSQGRNLESRIIDRLKKEAASLPRDAGPKEIKAFFKKIPTQYVLDAVIILSSDACGKKIKYWIKTHWKLIRPFLGHIFLRNAKSNQYLRLKEQLEKQGIKLGQPTTRSSFQASVQVVNLNTMKTKVLPASFVILGRNRILVTVDFLHGHSSAIINPEDPSSWRNFMRSTAFEIFEGAENETPYLVFYPPKITFITENQYVISTDYEVHEGKPEILVGKDSRISARGVAPEEQQHKAYEVFRQVQQQEDNFRTESKTWWTRYGFMRQQIKQEGYISLDELFGLMRVMDSRGAKKTTCAVFGISEEEYNRYEKKVYDLLSNAKDLTAEQFLGRAIKAFQGRVMLASVICYNTLWKIRATLLNRYPNAFKLPQNTSDPVGAIYHFFGTFFAAYAMQKCLVWRYHHDSAFKAEIDAKVKALKERMKVDLKKQSIEGLNNEELLFFFQYRLLQIGNENSTEIIALAGIFKEEVVEDGDTSREVEFDLRGATSAHALFETVYGVKLDSSSTDSYRGLMVKLMGKFINAPVEFGALDKLALTKLLDIPLTDLLVDHLLKERKVE